MRSRISIAFGLGGIILVMMSCTMPVLGVPVPTAVPSLTPDRSMTALFGSGVLGSLTPGPTDLPTMTETVTLTPLPSHTITVTAVPSQTASPTPTTTNTVGPVISPTRTSTVTPPPTLTARPPTLRPSPVKTRPGANVIAAFFTTPPVLDGSWDEWVTPQYSASTVTYGAASWVGTTDLSSNFRLGWDRNFLYIAARVWDDLYVQNASGYDIYKGDSLEILLDSKLAADYYYDVLSADDFQLGISPGNPNVDGVKEAYLWYPQNIRGARPQVQIASRPLSDGYQVEAAIPWNVFELAPVAGGRYGFAFSVSDNDNTTANVQQSMVSSAQNRHLTRPVTWGEMYLNP